MNLKNLISKIGEGNLPFETTIGPQTQGICCAGGGDVILETELIPLLLPLSPGKMSVDEWNAACITLIVHCVKNFAQVVEALEACRAALNNLHEVQRWDKNIEEQGDCIDEAVDAENGALAALAAAQTIQISEAPGTPSEARTRPLPTARPASA